MHLAIVYGVKKNTAQLLLVRGKQRRSGTLLEVVDDLKRPVSLYVCEVKQLNSLCSYETLRYETGQSPYDTQGKPCYDNEYENLATVNGQLFSLLHVALYVEAHHLGCAVGAHGDSLLEVSWELALAVVCHVDGARLTWFDR